jgi:hypothetical protein
MTRSDEAEITNVQNVGLQRETQPRRRASLPQLQYSVMRNGTETAPQLISTRTQ